MKSTKSTTIIILLVIVLVAIIIYLITKGGAFDSSKNQSVTNVESSELTSEEIDLVSKSIGAIHCTTFQTEDGRGVPIFGSGTFLTVDVPLSETSLDVFVTNAHVAESPSLRNSTDKEADCTASFNHVNRKHYYYLKYTNSTTILNDKKDVAVLSPERNNGIEKEISTLRQNNTPVPFCQNVATGKKVYVFGYPGSSDDFTFTPEPDRSNFVEHLLWSQQFYDYNGSRNLILSEGIISGKRGDDYFTTAKIDTGSSGGLAISKEENKLCIVGIPTWVSVGELDNLGVIQPINNILDAGVDYNALPL